MDARLRQTVRDRAESRCEYCHLPERVAELPFQIDQLIAEQHGGLTSEDNLAFACARSNRYKGLNLSGIDPESGTITRLFNPRTDSWSEHFFWKDGNLAAYGDRPRDHCCAPRQSSGCGKSTSGPVKGRNRFLIVPTRKICADGFFGIGQSILWPPRNRVTPVLVSIAA